ncbi:MAG TPA: hypothetical protein VFO00_05205 [Vitreimonas sp.]|nr:hypothetical protein [Vitreimonas sp.]
MGLKTWMAMVLGAALTAACGGGSPISSAANDPVRALLSGDAMMLVSFDANGDLSVTAEEINAGLAREFARADTSGDGSLSPIEFQNWANAVLGGGPMGPYRLDFDRNVDNTITRAEFDTEIRARVDQYDENGDDVLTRGEFTRLIGTARPPPERQRPRILNQ